MACTKLHIVNSIDTTTTASTVIIDFSTPATGVNKDRFCIKFPCCLSIPSTADTYAVQVMVNGTAVPVMDRYGNPAVASDFKKKRIYKGYFGNTTAAHVIFENVPFVCNPYCENTL